MKFYASVFFVFFVLNCVAQKKLILTNAREIDPERYADFEGSPYLFDDWGIAVIYDSYGQSFEDIKLNFNGYTNEVEIKQENQFIELKSEAYLKIEVKVKEDSFVFHRGMHKYFKNQFVEVVYNGKEILLLRRLHVSTIDKAIPDVGGNANAKRFKQKKEYYFIKEGKLQKTRLKKKSLLKFLGHKKEIEAFLKTNNLRLTNVNHLKKVLTFYEAQGF